MTPLLQVGHLVPAPLTPWPREVSRHSCSSARWTTARRVGMVSTIGLITAVAVAFGDTDMTLFPVDATSSSVSPYGCQSLCIYSMGICLGHESTHNTSCDQLASVHVLMSRFLVIYSQALFCSQQTSHLCTPSTILSKRLVSSPECVEVPHPVLTTCACIGGSRAVVVSC